MKELCVCGSYIGEGGWTCAHGGCKSMKEYYGEEEPNVTLDNGDTDMHT